MNSLAARPLPNTSRWMNGAAAYCTACARKAGRWGGMRASPLGAGRVAGTATEEEFITEHYWGYTRQRDGSTVEYRVTHPRWDVAHAAESSIHCDGTALYGPELGATITKTPASAFAIHGSAVTVYRGCCVEARA